mmetsp:Transcript_32632/g.75115  ORF Transcript_32632/g.75115 Transcript_32632/m.75115 type:complete len:118 (-) Transcript_32632:1730-2083(-)
MPISSQCPYEEGEVSQGCWVEEDGGARVPNPVGASNGATKGQWMADLEAGDVTRGLVERGGRIVSLPVRGRPVEDGLPPSTLSWKKQGCHDVEDDSDVSFGLSDPREQDRFRTTRFW